VFADITRQMIKFEQANPSGKGAKRNNGYRGASGMDGIGAKGEKGGGGGSGRRRKCTIL